MNACLNIIISAKFSHICLTQFLIQQGQVIDGPMHGRAPGPWEVRLNQPAPFAPTVIYQEIPHTASVQVRYIYLISLTYHHFTDPRHHI